MAFGREEDDDEKAEREEREREQMLSRGANQRDLEGAMDIISGKNKIKNGLYSNDNARRKMVPDTPGARNRRGYQGSGYDYPYNQDPNGNPDNNNDGGGNDKGSGGRGGGLFGRRR